MGCGGRWVAGWRVDGYGGGWVTVVEGGQPWWKVGGRDWGGGGGGGGCGEGRAAVVEGAGCGGG